MSCLHLHGDFQMFSNEIFFFLKKISNYSLEVLCEYFLGQLYLTFWAVTLVMKYILLGVQVLLCHFFETDSLFKHFT